MLNLVTAIVVSISPQDLPSMRAKPFHAYHGERVQQVSYLDSIVNLVSSDSLYAVDYRLQSFQTRYSFTDSVIAAANWIRSKLLSFGYDSVYFDSFPHPSNPSSIQLNVVGVKLGDQNPERVVLVGGHYDSVVYGGDPYTWAPGADDNGSGTTSTIEIARVISDISTDKTIYFVAFAAEEQGLYGSDHFADWALSHGLNIDLMVNLDMVAYEPNSYWNVAVESNQTNADFVDLAAEMALDYTSLYPQVSYSTSSYSDHWPFLENGYHAIFISEGDFNWNNWHEPTDVVDSLNFPYHAEVTKMGLSTLLWISERPDQPENVIAENAGAGMVRVIITPPQQTDVEGFYVRYIQNSQENTVYTLNDTVMLENLQSNSPVNIYVSASDTMGFISTEFGPVTIIPTGVGETVTGTEPPIEIFVNSLGNEVIIKASNGLSLSDKDVRIFSVDGRLVNTKIKLHRSNTAKLTIPRPGVYFVEVRIQNSLFTKKLLVFPFR